MVKKEKQQRKKYRITKRDEKSKKKKTCRKQVPLYKTIFI